ncbi:hypothetical protein JST97_16085 [bacterium]|nr:hypothetical protein [bacterium]
MSEEEAFAIGVPGLEEDSRPKGSCLLSLAHLSLFAGGFVFALGFLNLIQVRPQGQLTACKSNCKNIATALEMYAEDNKGIYPLELSRLTQGNYLRIIPTCPAANKVTYSNYRVFGAGNHYHFSCVGNNHAPSYEWTGKSSDNYPGYNSDTGLEEHP